MQTEDDRDVAEISTPRQLSVALVPVTAWLMACVHASHWLVLLSQGNS